MDRREYIFFLSVHVYLKANEYFVFLYFLRFSSRRLFGRTLWTLIDAERLSSEGHVYRMTYVPP